ncbi:MAG: DUF4147 domain-containing protein [Planctomycetales bacterium]|nr:DUF4147 domain-containing protein [Planctomycetales bacterium]
MTRTASQLRDDARTIWQAGVAAVDSQHLVQRQIAVDGHLLRIAGQSFPVTGELVVVGGGKAGAGMAAGLESSLPDDWLQRTRGALNVPEDCIDAPLSRIQLHGARPAGVNEPTDAGVAGTRQMMEWASSLGPGDLCLCLLSGGGSALMPLPIDGVTLQDKQLLTRYLSGAGANIAQLNTVRKQLSQFKGGGLARACRAQWLVTLIISDVIGDPLDVIASGPTVPDTSTPADALRILAQFDARRSGASDNVWRRLEEAAQRGGHSTPTCESLEWVIGNNRVAVEAAAVEAERLGYRVCAEPAETLEGDAEQVGRRLAERAIQMRQGETEHDCLITGGEPTVRLAPLEVRGRGGRNQQLAAAALEYWLQREVAVQDMALLSGGTDGEDGPTDAAGAWVGEALAPYAANLHDALQRNDTYPFFARCGGLLQTGPTHTNVCDVRVVLATS